MVSISAYAFTMHGVPQRAQGIPMHAGTSTSIAVHFVSGVIPLGSFLCRSPTRAF